MKWLHNEGKLLSWLEVWLSCMIDRMGPSCRMCTWAYSCTSCLWCLTTWRTRRALGVSVAGVAAARSMLCNQLLNSCYFVPGLHQKQSQKVQTSCPQTLLNWRALQQYLYHSSSCYRTNSKLLPMHLQGNVHQSGHLTSSQPSATICRMLNFTSVDPGWSKITLWYSLPQSDNKHIENTSEYSINQSIKLLMPSAEVQPAHETTQQCMYAPTNYKQVLLPEKIATSFKSLPWHFGRIQTMVTTPVSPH